MILLMGDTHDDEEAIKRIFSLYKDKYLSALIHLGDVTDFTMLSHFKSLKCEKYLVKGNNDFLDLKNCIYLKSIGFDFSNPPFEIFIDGFGHIALMHEPYFINEYLEDAKTKYIFYCHTHSREKKEKNNKYIVNPGSLSSISKFKFSYALVSKEGIEFKTL